MGRTPAKRKFNDDLLRVSRGASGQGLPYAPVDWPNSGDIWGWAVAGKGINQRGIYKNRFLYAPERLQRRLRNKLAFMSKISVLRYLQSEFPEADINVFFQSFTWDILGKTDSEENGKSMTFQQSLASLEENHTSETRGRTFKRTRQSLQRQKVQESGNVSEIFIDMTMENEGTLASSATTERREGAGFQDGVASASVDDGNAYGSLLDCKLEAPYFTLEEFDNYLNSLDELFALPSPGNNASFKRECVMKARQKLSSLLAIGFPSLVLSNKLGELLALTSELQKDPSLSPEELSTLKLIEEIPLNRQRYLKAKEASAQADKFFSDLDSKIVSVTSLKNEYNTAKQDKEVFLAEEASCLLAVLETNEKIAKLQSRRAAMAETIKMTNKRIVQCNYTQQKVMDCLPKIDHEVQVANSSKVEWDLKRKKSAEETAEILAKFAPLAGFSL